jgi:CIC family chloride channel protein
MDWIDMKQVLSLWGKAGPSMERFVPAGPVLLGIAGAGVGLGTGLGVWVFKFMIEAVHGVAFDWLGAGLSAWGAWTIALIPVLGGLVVGSLWHRFVGHERYHGVAGIMEAAALAGGRLQYRLTPMKTVTAAISIGAGASVGPEDPSVQIGANLGSYTGQKLRFSDDWVRTMVAAGVAAAISAAFNAPIAGVFFAIEIGLGELSGSEVGIVVLASVISAIVTQSLTGPAPAFNVPAYAIHSVTELPLYIGLGLLAGLVAAFYITALYIAKDAFRSWQIPGWLKPAAAGLAVGIVGIFLPPVFGVGYPTIDAIFAGEQMGVLLLIVLLLAKLVLTAICIGGGFPGGVFAPSLFLGATLGAAYGTVAQQLWPGLGIAPPAYAMVGMGAVLAASVHVPLTAILLLFEMTQDYRIILPLMAAVIVGLVVSRALRRDSVYTLGLARQGLRLQRGRDVEVLENLSVGEVMETNMPVLHESDSLSAAADDFMQTRHHGLVVVDEAGELVGILTVQDLERVQAKDEAGPPGQVLTVGDVCTRELQVVYPDESIGTGLRRMSTRNIGRLPVVARDNPSHLVGVLRRTDLVRAYDVALTRRTEVRHRAHQTRLGASTGTGLTVQEVVIERGAACANQPISDVHWPETSVIASIRRGRQMIIPHGSTVLRAGDVLVVVNHGPIAAEFDKLCDKQPDATI